MKTINALLSQDGKIWYVELPDKPKPLRGIGVSEPHDFLMMEYNKNLKEALSNRIEVHPESLVLAKNILYKDHADKLFDEGGLKEGECYPIEGVEAEIVEACKWNGNKDSCGNEACWDLGECQKSPLKQYVIFRVTTKP